MAAVKLVNGFMVKQLLKKDAEIISSTDDDGRTAVHWAAMVDNIEALRMLVKCGSETIKDAQDNKVWVLKTTVGHGCIPALKFTAKKWQYTIPHLLSLLVCVCRGRHHCFLPVVRALACVSSIFWTALLM